MLLYFILYFFFALFTQILTYKYIRFIDRKERKKLQKWEENFLLDMEKIKKEEKNDEEKLSW